MSTLEQQISRARFRLNLNTMLDRAALAVVLAAGLWSLAWIGDRALGLGLPLIWTFGGAAGLACVGTTVLSILARSSRLAAAVELDRAAGLKERVSSAHAIAGSADPFAQAAVRDAEKTAARVHVPAHIPVRAPRLWPWTSATVLAALLLYAFMPQLNLLASLRKKDDSARQTAALNEKAAVQTAYNEEMNKVRKMVDENPALSDLKDDLKSLELPDTPGVKPEDVRRDVLKKLDKISDQISDKREGLDLKSMEELKRRLSKLEPKQGSDPTSKLAQSLAQGNTEEARKAIDEMKKELEDAAGKQDPESQQKLQEMASKLEDLAKKLNELNDQKKLEKELENKAGLTEEQAKKMLDELSKMDPKQLEKELQKRLGESGMTAEQMKELAKKIAQNQEAKKQLQELAKKMAQAAKQCKSACQNQGNGKGDSEAQGAAQALSDAAQQLSDAEMAEQMASELEAQLEDLKELREGMCQGNCQGNKPGDEIGSQGPNEGRGYGSRIGKEAGAHKYKATKAQVRTQGGQIIGQMLIDGPQVKGEAAAEVRNAVNSAVRDATDAVERERIPRQYQDVTKKYFDELARLAGGSSGSPAKPAEPEKTPAGSGEKE
ncbi:MAG: hypothetical protein HZB38_09040 [Planctomycetes bacterium]|nr:hypothetical protein [Planctomycetota bacterium]